MSSICDSLGALHTSRSMLPIQVRLSAGGFHFAQASGLATQRAEIIQLGAADVRRTQHINLVDDFGVDGEDTLHALAKAHLAHGKAGLCAPALGDDDSFKSLQAFLVAFLDLHVDT